VIGPPCWYLAGPPAVPISAPGLPGLWVPPVHDDRHSAIGPPCQVRSPQPPPTRPTCFPGRTLHPGRRKSRSRTPIFSSDTSTGEYVPFELVSPAQAENSLGPCGSDGRVDSLLAACALPKAHSLPEHDSWRIEHIPFP
jgi:hypothetical protein